MRTVLDISEMTLRVGEEAPRTCRVPCSVQGVLVAHGRLPDVFAGHGLATATELARTVCVFSADVPVSEQMLRATSVRLHVGVGRRVCEVLLDGRSLGRTDLAVGSLSTEVRPYLTLPSCRLELRFDTLGAEGTMTDAWSNGVRFPATEDPAVLHLSLECRPSPCLDEVRTEALVTEHGASLHIHTTLHGSSDGLKTVATLTSPSGRIYYAGLPHGTGTLPVPDPVLWDPFGAGERAVYRLHLTLYRDDEPIDERDMTVGFVTVTETGATAHGRRTLTLRINGAVRQLRGCVFDGVTSPTTAASERMVRERALTAADAGLQALWIPADVPFPTDGLLELADRRGLVVGKSLPPLPLSPSERRASLDALVRELARCASHPCFTFVMTEDVTLDPAAWRSVAPRALCLHGQAVARTDGSACLQQLTSRGEGPLIESVVLCRPPASLPPHESVCAFAEGDENLYGRTVSYHAAGHSVPSMMAEAAERYPFPCGVPEATFLTGLAAADRLTEHLHRVRLAGCAVGAVSVGPLYDIYPSVSPSLIDAYGRRKPAFYAARAALAELLLVPVRRDYRVSFHVCNDRDVAYEGVLVYRVADTGNTPVLEERVPVTVEPHTVRTVCDVDLSTVVFGREHEHYVGAYLEDARGATPVTVTLLCPPKHVAYRPARVEIAVRRSSSGRELSLRSDVLIHGAYLSFADAAIVAEENLLSLTSAAAVRVPVRVPSTVTDEELLSSVRLLSVGAIGRSHSS